MTLHKTFLFHGGHHSLIILSKLSLLQNSRYIEEIEDIMLVRYILVATAG